MAVNLEIAAHRGDVTSMSTDTCWALAPALSGLVLPLPLVLQSPPWGGENTDTQLLHRLQWPERGKRVPELSGLAKPSV